MRQVRGIRGISVAIGGQTDQYHISSFPEPDQYTGHRLYIRSIDRHGSFSKSMQNERKRRLQPRKTERSSGLVHGYRIGKSVTRPVSPGQKPKKKKNSGFTQDTREVCCYACDVLLAFSGFGWGCGWVVVGDSDAFGGGGRPGSPAWIPYIRSGSKNRAMICVMLGLDSIRDGWTFMANTCFSVSAGAGCDAAH